MNIETLQGRRILLSASLPDELKGTPRAQGMYDLLVLLSRALAGAGARLLFGGHPSVTPLIDRAVAGLGVEREFLCLYQAAHFRHQILEQVADPSRFPQIHWIGDEGDDREAGLTAMRRAMAAEADAAILVGGRGQRPEVCPGLREEYALFLEAHPQGPLYLLGMLEGEAGRMIAEAEQGQLAEPNSLSAKELRLIHHADLVELVVPLMLADLGRLLGPHPDALSTATVGSLKA